MFQNVDVQKCRLTERLRYFIRNLSQVSQCVVTFRTVRDKVTFLFRYVCLRDLCLLRLKTMYNFLIKVALILILMRLRDQ
jgi:hypothetical protein